MQSTEYNPYVTKAEVEESEYVTGIYLDVIDFDLMMQMSSTPPTFANDLDINELESRRKLQEKLYTHYESDTIDNIPSCSCQHYKDARYYGMVCDRCGTTVMIPSERPIESALWIRAPEGVLALINPLVYTNLVSTFKKNGVSIIEWMIDPHYKAPRNGHQVIARLEALGIQRGLNYFISHFDAIINILTANTVFSNKKKAPLQRFKAWIERNRENLFPQALPVPSKLSFILEDIEVGRFADHAMADALDAVSTIASLNSGVTAPTQQQKENRAVKACAQLASFYEGQCRTTLGDKPGLFRRHVFGTRPAMSFRAVITSLSANHRYDEMHLPWSLAVSLFRVHIYNYLLRMSLSPMEARKHIAEAIVKVDPVVEQILNTLITTHSSSCGWPSMFQRNPSLKRLSAQRLFITKVKTDIEDYTIGFSVLVLKGMNADFDGRVLPSLVVWFLWPDDLLNSLNCWKCVSC